MQFISGVKVVHAAKPPTHNGQTALSFGIRLLARPTPRQPALRNSGMFSGVKQCSFPGLWQKRGSGRFHPGGMKAA